MGLIENPKTYTGRDLETIFFRPMLKGDDATALGIRVLYNMPVPTTIQMWSPQSDILQEYTSGWSGGNSAERKQKRIELTKIKAEVGFSASDYANQVYELITARADVNLDDLTGSELEQAETEMFRAAIAESLRVMMWIGNVDAEKFNRFNGFITTLNNYANEGAVTTVNFASTKPSADNIISILKDIWDQAPARLKSLKSEDMLAFFHAALITLCGRADLGNLCINAGVLKDLLPNLSSFGILRDTVLFVTDKASDINLVGIKTDFFG